MSTDAPLVESFIIHDAYMFGFWDWVGGIDFLWSAIGLIFAVLSYDQYELNIFTQVIILQLFL